MHVKDVAEQQCFLLSSVPQAASLIIPAGPVVCTDPDIDSVLFLQAGSALSESGRAKST